MKSYIRFLGRNKLYTAIMAVGLSVSLAFVIIMSCYVWQNLSVLTHYPDSERIHIAHSSRYAHTYRAFPGYIQTNIPEIEAATGINFRNRLMMSIGNEDWLDTRIALAADSRFFDVFQTKFIYGDKDVWKNPNNAIVTRSFAENHGGKDIIGKTLNIAGHEQVLTIAAVIEDFDKSIISNYNILLNMDNPYLFGEKPDRLVNPEEIWNGPLTFVKIKKGADAEEVCERINELHQLEYNEDYTFKLVTLRKAYLGGDESSFYPYLKKGNPGLMKIFSAIVLVLLISAIFNYVNLSTALAGKRSKEIASRMLLGEQRKEVLVRSITESLTFVAICMVLAVMIAIAVLPSINRLINSPVPLEIYFTESYILIYVAIMLLTALMCSLIPSLISVRFRPIEVVKGRFRYESKKTFSKIFIIIQNIIAVIIIAVTTVMDSQMKHMMEMPLGANIDGLYQCGISSLSTNLESELQKLPYIKRIGKSYGRPCSISYASAVPLDDEYNVNNMPFLGLIRSDKNAFDMFGYEIVRQYGPDSGHGIWLSETAFESLGMDPDNPVLPERWSNTDGLPFAGIIKDFAMTSALDYGGSPATAVFVYPDGVLPGNMGDFILETDELTAENRNELYWLCYDAINRLHGTDHINAGFIRDRINAEYSDMKKQLRMVSIFMFIAIMLSVLGQIAMSTYYATEREKEIGIRKVFGGTVGSESIRNIRDYMLYCLIACIIGTPIAVWIGTRYLETFAYRMPPKPWIYILACMAVFAISLASVLWQTLHAARTNPAEALKKE